MADLAPAGQELLDEVGVCQPGDEARGGPLRLLLATLVHALGPLAEWVRDSDDGPGWSILADPDRTPSPAWTGQLNGVVVTQGASEEQQRQELHIAAGMHRGSIGAMREAVAATLTGSRQVRILERDGTAYEMTVITRTSETSDPAASEAAARAQKPAGLLLTFLVSDAPIINEGTDTIDAATGVIDTATLADIT